ncbi:taste receptor type 1 member 3 [Acipenser ruthenus]|uniref:taste receptor type 1 member 3 n=1 Tax=Acipenser ruthenus TaxID=7906 RepID=UPI0027423120|nr:taste receptor type 1 member 3 [Acipenser ruthenus]
MSFSFGVGVLSCVLAAACVLEASGGGSGRITERLFNAPGDYILGGLFPIHTTDMDLSKRVEPGTVTCERFNSYGFARALVMKFAVEEINNSSTLLPGTALGYELYDTCMQSVVVMEPAMLFLTQQRSQEIQVLCNYSEYSTRAAAIIGPATSSMTATIGKLFSFLLIPQISYGATSDKFSDKKQFPSFLRTVPSDKDQAMGMVGLVSGFQWNWIAVVGSDDEYGKQGLRQFSQLASQASLCVAYEGLIPVYSPPSESIGEILDRLQQAQVEVVVLFSSSTQAKAFFIEVIRRRMRKVWIGSTAWVLMEDVSSLPGIETVGTVIGFNYHNPEVRGFEQYTRDLFTQLQSEQEQQRRRRRRRGGDPSPQDTPIPQTCPVCLSLTPENASMVTQPLVKHNAFSTYAAVYSVAHALHSMLGCGTEQCSRNVTSLYPWQLLEELKKVQFQLNSEDLKFDENGNPNIGQGILTWVWGAKTEYREIGTYSKGQLSIEKEQITWYTENKQVPVSQCSQECLDGQVRRVKGFHSCCFDCLDCQPGTFQNHTEDFQCTQCPAGLWSTSRSRHCSRPTFTFLDWGDYASLGLLCVACALLLCVACVALLFLRHYHTPLVRASGGPLSLLVLLGLACSSCSVVLFLGSPGDLVCLLQQPLSALSSALTISALLAVSLQVICVTDFPQLSASRLGWVRGLGSWLVVAMGISLQGGACAWFILNSRPLSQHVAQMEVSFSSTFLRCQTEPMDGFGLMLGCNGLLSLVSFMGTFMAQKPPKQYNMARDVTFSTLAHCVVWVVFIPIYTGLSEQGKSLAQMVAILLGNIGIVANYFLLKCHLLLTQPDLNTLEHFQIYIEGPAARAQPEEEGVVKEGQEGVKEGEKEGLKEGEKEGGEYNLLSKGGFHSQKNSDPSRSQGG